MARKNKKRNGHKKSFTLPIAVVAGFAPGVGKLYYHATHNDHGQGNAISNMGVEAGRIFIGIDPRDGKFSTAFLGMGLMPAIMGILVHKVVGGKFGVNRALASAGIPFIRL